MYGDLTVKFDSISASLNENDRGLLMDVYHFSIRAHEGQKRKSGEDYFTHPLAVGIKLWDKFGDLNLMCAGILHDTVEDNDNIDISEIYNKFGDEIGFIVDSVTKINLSYYQQNKVFDKKIDKFLYGGMKNVKCILLKIADRENNLETLGNLKSNKQIRMAFETQAIYSPLSFITGYNKNNITILKSKENLQIYIKNYRLNNYIELKNKLINNTFSNFSTKCFDSVYKNSSNVSWKITDKNMFENFINIPNIDNKITMELIQINENGNFLASFKFKKGEIISNNITFEIGDTYS